MFGDEETLGNTRISDWFAPEFFSTNFWFMWVTTFAFEPWQSAVELKRYLHRFLLEFSSIDTIGGVKRTVYNQYDSLVLPLITWLEARGVHILTEADVTALDHADEDGMFVVTGISSLHHGRKVKTPVESCDLVFLQNGSMTDSSSIGSMTEPPVQRVKTNGGNGSLWETLAQGRPYFGDPATFNRCIAQSWWGSFTGTLQDTDFFDEMQAFSGNEAATGGLVTFKDFNWLLSIMLPHQPHFLNQDAKTQVFWDIPCLATASAISSLSRCPEFTGADILKELCGHLRFDPDVFKSANCIAVRMPYITSMFMPRLHNDRPVPVPPETKNFALIGQFVEIQRMWSLRSNTRPGRRRSRSISSSISSVRSPP